MSGVEIASPVDIASAREEIARVTAEYGTRFDGGIDYQEYPTDPQAKVGFAVEGTLVDGSTLDHGLFTPDTELLIVERLPKRGQDKPIRWGVISGFVDHLDCPAGSPYTGEVFERTIKTEFEEEAGLAPEVVNAMQYVAGGRHSFGGHGTDGPERRMFSSALVCNDAKAIDHLINTDAGGEDRELGEHAWVALSALERAIRTRPAQYSTGLPTTLKAITRGFKRVHY